MKKMILLLALMLTTLMSAKTTDDVVDKTSNGIATVYGDSKDLLKTIYGDAKGFSPKVESALTELAKGLKVTSTKVWDILVKQQRVLSWCYLIGMLVGLLSWGHFYYRFSQLSKDLDNKGKLKDSNIWITTLSGITSMVFTVISVLHFNAMMVGFMNPEYPAMIKIAQVASTFK